MSKIHEENARAGRERRKKFLDVYARTHDQQTALDEIGVTGKQWIYSNTMKWKDFKAAYQAIKYSDKRAVAPGINSEGAHSVEWDGSFNDGRRVFFKRTSPWFHLELCNQLDKSEGGDIILVIWPPEHGKTSLAEDYCGLTIAKDPTQRITIGKEKIEFAEKVVSSVRHRFEDDLLEWWKLRERFGPFAPRGGKNAYGQNQTWAKGQFDVFKRRLGDERDFNMQALGINATVAGTRCDKLWIDDPQSRRSLNLTETILETIRDDWFSRPGVTGSTVILMNVVGDDDIGERLYNEGVCDHYTILKAYDPDRYEALGARPSKDGGLETSAWLWPERYSEKDYLRLKRNAGPEGWARKYQQDWRPAITRTFTSELWARCQNDLRKLSDPPPKHPSGKEGEIACSLDPSFKRTAVGAAAFEPTMLRVLDSYAERNMRTTGQMIDLLGAQIRHWHRPGIARVKWVVVETKGMQKGIITDDAFLELQSDFGFEVIEQVTGWDKHDDDFGVAQLARSMERAEIDIPAGDRMSIERFTPLRKEMLDWRPEIRTRNRGNKRVQDELMALWFYWTRWHQRRRRSIRRGTDASGFGFQGVPMLPGQRTPRPVPDLSKWRFGTRIGA